MKLTITTAHVATVAAILVQEQLVEARQMAYDELSIDVAYPDDAISQELHYWLAMATGCGLVREWEKQKR